MEARKIKCPTKIAQGEKFTLKKKNRLMPRKFTAVIHVETTQML